MTIEDLKLQLEILHFIHSRLTQTNQYLHQEFKMADYSIKLIESLFLQVKSQLEQKESSNDNTEKAQEPG